MSRKVFISFLGFSDYRECFYTRKDENFKSSNVRYIQEATIEYLMSGSEWTNDDVAYILLTKGAEERNWVDNGQMEYGTNTPKQQTGLSTQLQQMNLPFPVIPVKDLPDGNSEEEIWQIFSRVFELIQDGDEVYFDLTHGFRYLPMLILVVGNYAKFLKNITVKSITYGNFESRDRSTNEAPIIDLQSLSNLQDWTSATSSFVTNGNVSQIASMCKQDLKPLLRESKGANKNALDLNSYMSALEKLVLDLNTCRGKDILKGKNIKLFHKQSQLLDEIIIEPMKPIIKELEDSFKEFSTSENMKNGYIAAKWCFDNKMYQQSLTILQEMLFAHAAKIMGWEYLGDPNSTKDKVKSPDEIIYEKQYNITKGILSLLGQNKPIEKLKYQEEDLIDIERVVANPVFKEIALIKNKTTNIRNDYNHSGFRKDPKSPKVIIKGIKENLDLVQNLLYKIEECS